MRSGPEGFLQQLAGRGKGLLTSLRRPLGDGPWREKSVKIRPHLIVQARGGELGGQGGDSFMPWTTGFSQILKGSPIRQRD